MMAADGTCALCSQEASYCKSICNPDLSAVAAVPRRGRAARRERARRTLPGGERRAPARAPLPADRRRARASSALAFPGEDDEFLPARADVLPAYRGTRRHDAPAARASDRARELGFAGCRSRCARTSPATSTTSSGAATSRSSARRRSRSSSATRAGRPSARRGRDRPARRRSTRAACTRPRSRRTPTSPGSTPSTSRPSRSGWPSRWTGRAATRGSRSSRSPTASVVGYASVDVIGETGYHGLTGVRRAFRRRGVGRALKLHQIAAAKALGLTRLITESEETNVADAPAERGARLPPDPRLDRAPRAAVRLAGVPAAAEQLAEGRQLVVREAVEEEPLDAVEVRRPRLAHERERPARSGTRRDAAVVGAGAGSST